MFVLKSVGLFIALVLVSCDALANIDPKLKVKLDDDNGEQVDIILVMKDSFKPPDFTKLAARSFPSREDRLNSVYKQVHEAASKSQKGVLKYLNDYGKALARAGKTEPEFTSLWISNMVGVKNADAALIKELSTRPDIERISLDQSIKVEPYIESDADGDSPDGTEDPWGITALNVPAVWEKGFRGEGVVVGNMDSGVRVTHEALSSNYIGEGGWFDINGLPGPYDEIGHGTATMSNIVGTTRNVGVAPGAKWMTCNVQRTGSNSYSINDLLTCCQWMACPGAGSVDPGAGTNCSLAPHIIGQSGGVPYEYRHIIDKSMLYFFAAGIITTFSAQNYGPDCCSLAYPGAESYSFSIGAIRKNYTVWHRSSRGPPLHDLSLIKPDLVAPGVKVRVAWNNSDTAYNSVSGTSFASPHVAGVIALMLSKNPNLNFKQVKEILLASTLPTVSTGESCGKPDDEFPNFIAGHGRLDALKAIEYMDTMEKSTLIKSVSGDPSLSHNLN